MTTGVRKERVEELGSGPYIVLRESYLLVQELKGMVDRYHGVYLKQGSNNDFDTLSAIKLTTDRLYEEMERFLRPECDPDSAYPDAMTEPPTS